MYFNFIKPLCDFFIALFLLIILSPIILLTAILLFLANNGKVFFFQLRPGLNSKPFKIVKFKTMRDAFDQEGIISIDTRSIFQNIKMQGLTSSFKKSPQDIIQIVGLLVF